MARPSIPDAPYWPGRRWLGALDAVVWPLALTLLLVQAGLMRGLFGAAVAAWLSVSACRRLWTAWLENQRYRFTTWRVGRLLVVMVAFGYALKLAMELQRLA